MEYRRDPFKHVLAEAYVTAVNILVSVTRNKGLEEKGGKI